MGKLTELEQWDEDIYQIETSDPVLGGPEGLSNRPQKQLANRTQWLKKQLEDANNALAEHEKSRNHPDATLTDKGFVKLYSGVTSMDETMAATPKAVKIAMDNANERLAKARNLADLQSVPLALANLTLANVKKYVESTNTGVSKLPQFRPSSEDDLTSLPAGYMALVKNSTPGGPLPDENWFYLEVAGNLDNPSNNPNRKGVVIRLIQVSTPEISWTGVKFDDGTTTTAKFKWSRDFNTLNKPTPEDVGLAATKKAIDDTQTGLAVQSIMWVSTADDLSNLPSGAHRFARNNTGVTVLPESGCFFLDVLAKRDGANGSCILATSDTKNVWMGVRYNAPTDTAFTWIQLNQNVENLGLTEAVKRANNAVQKNGDTMTGNLFLKNDERMHFAIANEDGKVRMWLYKDKGGDGIRLNNGIDGGGDFVFGKNNEFYSPSHIHAGSSLLNANGNINGAIWGGWLSDWLNTQFAARDNGINVRATIAWVNQNFVQNIDLTTPETIQFWDGKGWPRATDGAAMYNFQMVGGSSNVGWFQVRYTRKLINGTWHVIN
ncbi:hypothetical protein G3G77_001960 [Salmonella enterica]|nr:hypothetical protein [Salmonella enterica]EEH7553375.1 hypothetical protein [Salmonella enterica]EIF5979053.1 tail fiber protein [Salmonella enterica]